MQKSSYYLWAGVRSGQEGTEDLGDIPQTPFSPHPQALVKISSRRVWLPRTDYIIHNSLSAKRKRRSLCSKVIKNFKTVAAEPEIKHRAFLSARPQHNVRLAA